MQDSSLYRPVLKNAFAFAWKEKRFWILAFFATLMMSGGIYDLALRRSADATARGIAAGLPSDITLPNALEIIGSFRHGATFPAWMIVVMLISLVLAVIFIWLSASAQGALISAAAGESKGPDALRSAFGTGAGHFWKIFWLNLFNKIAVGVVIFVLAIPATMLASGAARGSGLYLAAFIVLVPLVLIVSFLTLFAMTAVVVHEESVGEALAHAWRTFTGHWLVSLEMAAIIFVIDALAAIAVSLGIFLVALPFVLLYLVAAILGSPAGVSFITAAMALAILGFVFAAGSFLTALRYSAWTGLYLRTEKKKAHSKILRWFNAHV